VAFIRRVGGHPLHVSSIRRAVAKVVRVLVIHSAFAMMESQPCENDSAANVSHAATSVSPNSMHLMIHPPDDPGILT
jgi:hypothetical protein